MNFPKAQEKSVWQSLSKMVFPSPTVEFAFLGLLRQALG